MAFIQQGTLVNNVVVKRNLTNNQRSQIVRILVEKERSRRKKLILRADARSQQALAEIFVMIREGDFHE